MDDPESNDPQPERPRPRVVDKRVSARDPSAEPPSPRPAPEAPQVQEPSAQDPVEPTQAEREADEEMIRQIAATPSRDWVINVLLTLMNVADVKLGTDALEDARIAIETVAATLERVGDELGEASAPLRQGLAQLQLAYASKAGG
jgi:hypothetical protein